MAEIRQDLKLQSDPSTIVRPNIITDCIPDGAITANKIAYYSIGHSWLAEDAVQDDNILDNAVITSKINAAAVTTAKIASGAVTEDKIASAAITNLKIASGAIDRSKLRITTITLKELIEDEEEITTISDFEVVAEEILTHGFYSFYYVDGGHTFAATLCVSSGVHLAHYDGTQWVDDLIEDQNDFDNLLLSEAAKYKLMRIR